jgi:UDP-N-acetyl-D-mannosaminuronic acid transferase (WecB/TagA/CpsF family)
MAARLRDVQADVVVLGLGAPLQDSYLLDLLDNGLTGQLLLTCGGWIDQVSQSDYYPSYAYRLRLNWLVRVLREPARLWRRYTVEGVRAFARRKALRHHLLELGARPFAAMLAACSPEQVAPIDRLQPQTEAA